jgi:hypothetical protein
MDVNATFRDDCCFKFEIAKSSVLMKNQLIQILFVLFAFSVTSSIHGQTDCFLDFEVVVSTEMWGDEISWNIAEFNGVIVAEGGDYESYSDYSTTVCLDSSCYVVNLYDSFGDGWNGASLSLNIPSLGIMLGEYTMDIGNEATFVLPLGGDCSDVIFTDLLGCTDPLASNYNPNATVDDGTCDYQTDCDCADEPYDPVCALDSLTASLMEFDNLCLALCANAFLLDSLSCEELDGLGCTDPEASNFNPFASEDDGSCEYPCGDAIAAGTLYLCTFNQGQNVALTITNESGNVLYEGSDFGNYAIVYEDLCLEAGCYTATLSNTAGEGGWYNGYFYINSGGAQIVYATLSDDASEWIFEFSIDGSCGEIWGCTDPDASNYNPDATQDDGSCITPCVCDDVYEPVCGYDYLTGLMQTYSNICELTCAGAYFYWEGDCSEQPIYGCTDPDALNYNPEATVESGCIYSPNCEGNTEIVFEYEFTNGDSLWPGGGADPFGSVSFYLTDEQGIYWNDFVQFVSDEGILTTMGCLDDGCYNLFVYSNQWDGTEGSIDVTWNDQTTTYTLSNDSGYEVFGLGINVDDCEPVIFGCTDPDAFNYNSQATEDDGSCYFPFECEDGGVVSNLYICTFSNGAAVGLTIEDSEGNVVFDQQGFSDMQILNLDICLDPNACYTATMSNNGDGTGWYNGYFYINSGGVQIAYDSLDDNVQEESFDFSIGGPCGEIYGCMDELATNFNPDATVDNGSCIFPLDCTGFIQVTGVLTGTIWLEETSWFLIGEDGQIWFPGSGLDVLSGQSFEGCVPAGCYELVLEDSFGDGWNGAVLTLSWEGTAETFGLASGNIANYSVGIGASCTDTPDPIAGCMDAGANNYNPNATTDDGSCEFSFCPTNEVMFVTVTLEDGLNMGWSIGQSTDSIPLAIGGGYANNGAYIQTACLADGCYDFTLFDGNFDGWNGGWVEVWMDGDSLLTTSLDSGASTSLQVGIGIDCEEGGDPGTGGSPFLFDEPIAFAPYPNPTEEIINVNGSGFDQHLPVVIDIRDITGKLIASRQFVPSEEASAWRFDCNGWANGLYQIIGTQGNKQAAGRFVVTR